MTTLAPGERLQMLLAVHDPEKTIYQVADEIGSTPSYVRNTCRRKKLKLRYLDNYSPAPKAAPPIAEGNKHECRLKQPWPEKAWSVKNQRFIPFGFDDSPAAIADKGNHMPRGIW